MQAAGEDDALLQQVRQKYRACDVLREVDGSHAVCLFCWVRSHLFETKVGNGLFDLLGGFSVSSKTLG